MIYVHLLTWVGFGLIWNVPHTLYRENVRYSFKDREVFVNNSSVAGWRTINSFAYHQLELSKVINEIFKLEVELLQFKYESTEFSLQWDVNFSQFN
jgi:hypothetical protein